MENIPHLMSHAGETRGDTRATIVVVVQNVHCGSRQALQEVRQFVSHRLFGMGSVQMHEGESAGVPQQIRSGKALRIHEVMTVRHPAFGRQAGQPADRPTRRLPVLVLLTCPQSMVQLE